MHTYTRTNEKWLPRFCCFVRCYDIGTGVSVPLQGYAAQAAQKTFASPEEAVKALADAVKADNMKELTAIFGPAGKEVLSSGDAVRDRAAREQFLRHTRRRIR